MNIDFIEENQSNLRLEGDSPVGSSNSRLINFLSKKSYLRQLNCQKHVHTFIQQLKRQAVLSNVPNIQSFEGESQDSKVNGVQNDWLLISFLFLLISAANFCQIFFQGFMLSYPEFVLTKLYIKLQPIFIVFNLIYILMNLFVFREQNGNMLITLVDIQKYYLKSYFLVDLLSLGMQIINIIGTTPWINLLLYLLKSMQLHQSVKRFEASFITTQSRENIWRLLYLFFLNIHYANALAMILNSLQYLDQQNWLVKYKIQDQTWLNRYLYTVYWSITTVMTVGYGDITPNNPKEAVIVGICQLVGGIIYAYNLNMIGNVINRVYHDTEQLQSKMRIMRKFFRKEKKELGSQIKLKNQILNSVRNNIYNYQARDIKAQNEVISSLQTKLSQTVLLKLRTDLLNTTPFLNSLSREFKSQLALALKKEVYSNEQYLSTAFKPNAIASIIQRGMASSIIDVLNKQHKVQQYRAGYCVGLRTLISQRQQHFNVRCQGVCEVLQIPIAQLQRLIRNNKSDLEKYCNSRDSSYHNFYPFDSYCKVCKYSRHSLAMCPSYHYTPITFYSLVKSRRNDQQTSQPFSRIRNRQKTCFLNHFKRRGMRRLSSFFLLDEENMKKSKTCTTQQIQLQQEECFQSEQPFQQVKTFKYYFKDGNVGLSALSYNKRADKKISHFKLF